MIQGRFGEIGELFFDINLIAKNEEILPVEALLDTGFTTGWLALDILDAEAQLLDFNRTKTSNADSPRRNVFCCV